MYTDLKPIIELSLPYDYIGSINGHHGCFGMNSRTSSLVIFTIIIILNLRLQTLSPKPSTPNPKP